VEARAPHSHREIRRLPARGLATDAVDDDEQPAGGVDVEAILVDLALQARMRVAGGSYRADRLHDAVNAPARPRAAATPTRRRARREAPGPRNPPPQPTPPPA